MQALPMEEVREELQAAWTSGSQFLLEGPTGSGKSTRVPGMLIDWDGFDQQSMVIVLQPRRMAARLLAERVSFERRTRCGEEVGYQVRFESRRSRGTRIVYVTEGVLTRWLLAASQQAGRNATEGDWVPNGLRVGAVLFDEFHERHLEGDVAFALVRRMARLGWPGKIGLMSATIKNLEGIETLGDFQRVSSKGRQYPVEVIHAGRGGAGSGAARRGGQPEPVWERVAEVIRRAMGEGAEADFLVFLPGKYEIQKCENRLQSVPELCGWEILPLHGELPLAAQIRAVQRGERPRILLSTNIAETSLTIPGVRTVVDSGLAREAAFDHRRGLNTLLTVTISLSSAIQRAGRAGRVAPGRCYRLWSRSEEESFRKVTTPEIDRLDLAPVRLQLAVGELERDRLPWLSPPATGRWEKAGTDLAELGAIIQNESGEWAATETGTRMAHLPLHPKISRILLAAAEEGCLDWIIPAVAVWEGRRLLLPVPGRERERAGWWVEAEGFSDAVKSVIVLRRALVEGAAFCREWGIHWGAVQQAVRVCSQLETVCREMNYPMGNPLSPALWCSGLEASFGKSLLAGFSSHVALRRDRATYQCKVVGGVGAELQRDTIVDECPLVVAMEVEEREARSGVVKILSTLTRIEPSWLQAAHPEGFVVESGTELDLKRRRVVQMRRTTFRGLILEESESLEPTENTGTYLARGILEHGWVLKNWNSEVDRLISRIAVLAHYYPELEISPIREEDRELIVATICEGATAYKEIKDREVMPEIWNWLPAGMREFLERVVPDRFVLGENGRGFRLRYEDHGEVVLAAKLQAFYDIEPHSLVICEGRCRLRLELLAPNGRVAHVTDSLAGFWEGAYLGIRKELYGRYPKHEWR